MQLTTGLCKLAGLKSYFFKDNEKSKLALEIF